MNIGPSYLGDGRCEFVVWAPKAREIGLKLSSPEGGHWSCAPMEAEGDGYWRAVAEAWPGSRYFYTLDGREMPDPASHFQPLGVFGPSEVVDHSSFTWNDEEWENLHPASMVIYEIHTGVFTPEGRLDSIIEKLDDLADLGVNAVELMPVAQFPGTRNWGYDGAFPFAVQNTYGGPEALKRLVDECHSRGMSVILDVVYNHFGPEGSPAPEFGPYLTDSYMTPWGMAMNLDGAQSDHVRNYFIENALHWFERYHVDGLRLDAVHAMIDTSAMPFLKALRRKAGELGIKKGRPFYLFAEDDLNDTRAVSTDEHSFGLDGLWCDDFHHSLHALLTGERDGYYSDFGAVWQLVKSMNEGFAYSGQHSRFRQRSFGSRSILVPKDKFIVFSQNHDQVGNRALGERLSTLVPFEGLKLASGCLLLSPYVPLIFMGEEYGEEAPFHYFVSHSGGDLIAAVRDGRKKEFSGFMAQGEPPSPDEAETFESSILSWERRTEGAHGALLNLYRTLIRIRREVPALSPMSSHVHAWGLEEEAAVFLRKEHNGSSTFTAFNFNRSELRLKMPFPEGKWVKSLDSAEEVWEGPGSDLPGVSTAPAVAVMKPLSFALFIKED
ncbi:maltooligosyltrehalose trehalohydrolase [uncultured bacterium]|nr:maltooligosyltrehalose trehalohydrolase [uncultured bacterium]